MTDALTTDRVVLPSSTWREELAAELQSLGIEPEAADAGAVQVLQRILSRAGWPRDLYGVATRDEESEGDL